jgi:hypothetical protein
VDLRAFASGRLIFFPSREVHSMAGKGNWAKATELNTQKAMAARNLILFMSLKFLV